MSFCSCSGRGKQWKLQMTNYTMGTQKDNYEIDLEHAFMQSALH
jgi:hypothetical protein